MDASRTSSAEQNQIRRYLVFRFAQILMAFGLVMLYQLGLEGNEERRIFQFLCTVLATHTALGLLALIGLNRVADRPWFVRTQVAVDFVLAALLTGPTGGALSMFCPLLFVSLFSACTVLSWRGIVLCAALASGFLAVVTLGYALRYFEISSPRLKWLLSRHQLGFITTYLIGVGIALHIVALLGSHLAAGLQRIQSLQTEILENMGEGLIATEVEGRIVQINSEARRLLEIDDRSKLIGKRLSDVVSSERFDQIRRIMSHESRSRSEVDMELPSGTRRKLEIRASTIRNESGKARCRIALFDDLALEKEVEEAERRIQRLEELYHMAMGIAHEIRNPLASIRGCIQEIGRLEKQNPSCDKLVRIVCRESDRLDLIIEEFLCYTRKQPRPSRPVNLRDIVDAAVVLLENHSRRRGRTVVWENSPEPCWILGDWERIQQILLNLGINALDATDESNGRVTFKLRMKEFVTDPSDLAHGDGLTPGVEIEVVDDGEGIPQENLDKIFTPFFTSKEGGTGLGLALVHRFVHDHGGVIRVESRPGEGTRFAVWFPIFAGSEESRSAGPEEAAETRQGDGGSRAEAAKII